MSKQTDKKAIDQVIQLFNDAGIATMSKEQRSSFFSGLMLASYQLMRSTEGDEFVRGFFESALEELANPAPVEFVAPH